MPFTPEWILSGRVLGGGSQHPWSIYSIRTSSSSNRYTATATTHTHMSCYAQNRWNIHACWKYPMQDKAISLAVTAMEHMLHNELPRIAFTLDRKYWTLFSPCKLMYDFLIKHLIVYQLQAIDSRMAAQ